MITKPSHLEVRRGWRTLTAGILFAGAFWLTIHLVADKIFQRRAEFALFLGIDIALVCAGGIFLWFAGGERSAVSDGKARIEAHPDEPWLWPSDWAAGKITYSGKAEAIRYWKFTFFIAALCGVIFEIFRGVGSASNLPGVFRYLPAFFLLVLVILVAGALVVTRRATRFGDSTLELETLPGIIGGGLKGRMFVTLRTEDLTDAGSSSQSAGLSLTLRCQKTVIERSTTSSNRSVSMSSTGSVRDVVLWQSKQTVHSLEPTHSELSVIPLFFEVPSDAVATSLSAGDGCVTWTVTAQAKLRGPNFYAEFEVPIFAVPRKVAGGESRLVR